MKKKILLFKSKVSSDWISCQSITSELIKLYESLPFYEVQVFEFEMPSRESLKQVETTFKRFAPDYIVFIDHAPHPINILKVIDSVCADTECRFRPVIIMHIYGDFLLFIDEWKRSSAYLENFKVMLLTASDAHLGLVKKFVNTKTTVKVFPFPIDQRFFELNLAKKSLRNKLKISEDDFVFAYTGRLSRQKQIIPLLELFSRLQDDRKSQLILAGEFDDLGVPYLRKHDDVNQYFNDFLLVFKKLPSKVRERIHFLGLVGKDELKEIYQASDCFISLSLHNDEDYGVSPGEALATGLPAILTKWGGYLNFSTSHDEIFMVPTAINDLGPVLDKESAYLSMRMISESNTSQTHKIENARKFEGRFGKKILLKKLQEYLASDISYFDGFDFKKLETEKVNEFRSLPVFKSHDDIYNNSYIKTYEFYSQD